MGIGLCHQIIDKPQNSVIINYSSISVKDVRYMRCQ